MSALRYDYPAEDDWFRFGYPGGAGTGAEATKIIAGPGPSEKKILLSERVNFQDRRKSADS
jgi:hypothetical protein